MKIETYGLNPVPPRKRTATAKDMLFIWSGISFCIPSFMIGGVLIPTFSWQEALGINFFGNLAAGCLIVLGGYFGTRTGLPAVVFGKRVFGGKLGHLLPTVCLVASTLFWFSVLTFITGNALDEIVRLNTGFSNPPLFIFLAGILNSYTAVFGFDRIRRFSWISVPVLTLFCIFILYYLFQNHISNLRLDYQKTGLLSYWEGLDIVIGGYIAGALAASDYSRYTDSNRINWLGVLPGTFLVSFLLGVIGMLSAAATGEWNPVREVLSFGMGVPALCLVFIANWTTNYSLLYSAGLAATNMFPKASRWKNTLIMGIIGTALAILPVDQHLQDILSFLALVFSPLVGVLLSDFFFCPHIYKEAPPENTAPVNIPAVAAVLTGFLAAHSLSQYLGTSVVGLASGSLSYLFYRAAFRRPVSR